jgi:vitamin B12 transporter
MRVKSLVIRSLYFGLYSLFFIDAALADSDDKLPVERIVITGEQPTKSANYTVISRSDFINKAQTLSDLLNQINGIQIRQISGVGNPVAVSIRGSSSKQVQLYIDGQLINDSQFGGFDLNQIPVEHIQSIELSKDQAIGTGATPIGGVIRINTYNASKDTLRLSAGLGSLGTRELNATKNIIVDGGHVSFAASHLASDNDYDFLVNQPVNNPGQSQVQALTNNEFEKNTVSINSEFRSDVHQVRLNGQYTKQDKALPLYQNNAPSNRSSLSSEIARVGGSYLYQPSINWLEQLEIESYVDAKKERYINSIDGVNVRLGRYQTDKANVSIKPTMLVSNFTITPFVDVNVQEFTSHSTYNGESTSCNGIGACDVKATSSQWVWGTRVDWRNDNAPLSSHLLISQLIDSSDNIVLNQNNMALNQNNSEKITNDNDFMSGEVGFSYDWRTYTFAGALSHGVRMPTLFELYGDRGLFKGNGNLNPEQSNAVSLSVDYTQATWSINSSVYYKQVEDAIVATFNSAGIGSYGNINDANIAGWELQADYQLTKDMTLYGQVNIVDSVSKSVFIAFNNKKIPNIYHQEISAKLSYDISEQWSINLNTQYSQGLYFNLTNRVEQHSQGNGNPSDKWLTNVQANWQHNAYSLSISVNNVFDDKYQDLANRPAQGSNFLIKFSFEE